MRTEEIVKVLHELENKKDIDILYACESGSRAWGFANDESDYDIRFIYKKRSLSNYLSLREPSDVIKLHQGDFDIEGWDIKKALNLHYKSNPSLREWLDSDMIYIDNGIQSVFSGLGGFDIDFLKNYYNVMAENHWGIYFPEAFNKWITKEFLYTVRSILCWNLLDMDIYPPVNIHDLLEHKYTNIDDDVKSAVYNLIGYYQGKNDLNHEGVYKLIHFFIDSIPSMRNVQPRSLKDFELYDERFRELLLVCR